MRRPSIESAARTKRSLISCAESGFGSACCVARKPAATNAMITRSPPLLVSGGPVARRHRYVEQTQVHAELRAVMHDVVDVLSHDGLALHGHQHVITHL